MKPGKLTLLTALLASLAASPIASSHSGATGVVKERMEMMKGMGKQMKRMGAMAKGKAPFEAAAFAEGGALIAKHSPQMTALFPEGSLQHPTEALPSIWEEWERFEQSAQDLEVEAGKLRAVAAGGEKRAVIGQFARTGKVCSGCHKAFRKKKKKD